MEGQKQSNSTQEDTKLHTKKERKIKFNLDKNYLKCFMSDKKTTKAPDHRQALENPGYRSERESIVDSHSYPLSLSFSADKKQYLQEYGKNSLFNNKLLIIEFDQKQFILSNQNTPEEFTDSPQQTCTPSKNQMISPKRDNVKISSDIKKLSDENLDESIIAQCLRVITQETDNTSNPSKDSNINMLKYNSIYPYYYQNYSYMYQQPKESFNAKLNEEKLINPQLRGRNKKSFQQSENGAIYKINVETIEKDGRTTLMLRNIPNKYTRDMILEEINAFKDFNKKYDFFYLPIDYRNQCNVGYAFINLIHTKFIHEFYTQFHMKKWQKFNSQKICQICYARIQGTIQLLNHFKDSNVIQQKDKKIRPLIDFKDTSLLEIVKRQKNQTTLVPSD